MAPTPPPTARRPLTLKGLPRKKPGPVPKPLSERLKNKPVKPLRRVERSYTRERKIEVLLYLLNHRIPDNRHRRQIPRSRVGQSHEHDWSQSMIQNASGEYVWHRAPTYAEASEFWKIPTPTIQGWWDSRKKLLEGSGIELPENANPPPPTPTHAPMSSATDRPQGAPLGAAVERRNEPPSAEKSAPPPVTPSGPAPSPDPSRDPPGLNPTPLPTARRPPSPTRTDTQPQSAAQPTPVATGQQPFTTNGAQLPRPPVARAGPGAQAPLLGHAPPRRPVESPAARPPSTGPSLLAPRTGPPVGSLRPPGPRPAQPPVARPAPPRAPPIPPALDPANYAVVYMGPQPGPSPGQPGCLPPGTLLPVVYSGQLRNVPPVTYFAVYPSYAPVPYGAQPPPQSPVCSSPYPPPYPGQHHFPHERPVQYTGPHGPHHPPPYHQGHPGPSAHATQAPPPQWVDPRYARPCPPPKLLEKLFPPALPPPPPPQAAQAPPTPTSSAAPPTPSPSTVAPQAEAARAAGLRAATEESRAPMLGPDTLPAGTSRPEPAAAAAAAATTGHET
ncbi:hypothetical protein BT67DRAFT_444530 [Trichocladium antarcticum]|uniref:Uncharacterized protein n=1 Tax=Trichocladium antarcticum TaxID=1450529 RepID=A0AAN6UEY8_9PEZI|nr:hypothetical protein BT67DRAFT_444530 [Trichocladium antarcticum]